MQMGYRKFLKRRLWQIRVIQKHKRCGRRKKLITSSRQEQIGVTKTKIICRILNAIHAWFALLSMSLFSNSSDALDDVFHLNPNHTFSALHILPALWYFFLLIFLFLTTAGYEISDV